MRRAQAVARTRNRPQAGRRRRARARRAPQTPPRPRGAMRPRTAFATPALRATALGLVRRVSRALTRQGAAMRRAQAVARARFRLLLTGARCVWIAHATQLLLQAVVILSIVLVFQGIPVLLRKVVFLVHVIPISSQVDQVRAFHVQANLIRFLVAHHVNVKPDTKEEIIRKYIMAVCS